MKDILNFITSIFKFSTAERDPEKQRGRRINKEYKVTKSAVRLAVRIFNLESKLEYYPRKTTTDIKRRSKMRKKVVSWKDKFFRLLAIE